MAGYATINRYYLLSFNKEGSEVCDFVDGNSETPTSPDYDEHLNILRDKFGVDGLLILSHSNRVLYIFTSDQNIDQLQFLSDFFPSTHPQLSEGKIELLLGNTLLFKGEEALMYLFNFALNPTHLDYIPEAIEKSFVESEEMKISNNCLRLLSEEIHLAKSDIQQADRSREDYRSFHQRIIVNHLIDLADKQFKAQVAIKFTGIPEKLTEVKDKAINVVFEKELSALKLKDQETIKKLIEYVEREYSRLDWEQLEDNKTDE